MSLVQLSLTEEVSGRPFTDLRHTAQDSQTIRFMITCVGLTLEGHPVTDHDANPVFIYQPTQDRWIHRIVITQPSRLLALSPVTVVGFFGLKSPTANVALAQELDRQLIPELSNYDELLAYVSVCLPTGNFGNLVLFATAEGKDDWGRSLKHAEAVRLLTPDYYSAVRLYNGDLPGGIGLPDTLRLGLIKYYDYETRPLWRAVRMLSPNEQHK